MNPIASAVVISDLERQAIIANPFGKKKRKVNFQNTYFKEE